MDACAYHRQDNAGGNTKGCRDCDAHRAVAEYEARLQQLKERNGRLNLNGFDLPTMDRARAVITYDVREPGDDGSVSGAHEVEIRLDGGLDLLIFVDSEGVTHVETG